MNVDHGWFGVDEDYRIVIPWECFKEEAVVESRGMMQFEGERIELPREERFMSSLEGLRWYRERWGVRQKYCCFQCPPRVTGLG